MGTKRRRSKKQVAETDWGETKSERLTIALTATGKRELDKQCEEKEVSRSELMERYIRGVLSVPPLTKEERERLFSPINPIRLTVEQVLEAIKSFTFKDLGRVAQTSVRSIVQRKFSEEEHELEETEELAIAFLKKLINQQKPSNIEIGELAELMDEDFEKIAALVAKIRNGEGKKNGST